MTLDNYIDNINQRYKRGNATQHTFRGDLQQLIESIVPEVRATNEPKRRDCGAPDYILTKKDILVGFIEAKDIGDKDLEGKKKSYILVPDDTNIYHVGHKLAQKILNTCKETSTPVSEVEFDYTNTPTKVTLLEKHIGKSGWLLVQHLYINSFEYEDYLLLACFNENGEQMDQETAQRLFSLEASEKSLIDKPEEVQIKAEEIIYHLKQDVITENATRNRDFYDVEMDKLDQWLMI